MEEKYITMITETAERSKSNTHQIEEMKTEIKAMREDNKSIAKIATSVELIAKDMTYMKKDIGEVKQSQSELKTELSEVKSNPAKRKAEWFDSAEKLLFTAIATGIIAFILGNTCPIIFG